MDLDNSFWLIAQSSKIYSQFVESEILQSELSSIIKFPQELLH